MVSDWWEQLSDLSFRRYYNPPKIAVFVYPLFIGSNDLRLAGIFSITISKKVICPVVLLASNPRNSNCWYQDSGVMHRLAWHLADNDRDTSFSVKSRGPGWSGPAVLCQGKCLPFLGIGNGFIKAFAPLAAPSDSLPLLLLNHTYYIILHLLSSTKMPSLIKPIVSVLALTTTALASSETTGKITSLAVPHDHLSLTSSPNSSPNWNSNRHTLSHNLGRSDCGCYWNANLL